ncbi:MAG TPA: hypothetical protein PKA00_22275 [Saprospiraceae bacterium]|nr:hypothetical protein [Saprospiraceae bacterium]HMQ85656.1 hypothetical protein [Saprospiraceae bacterium]
MCHQIYLATQTPLSLNTEHFEVKRLKINLLENDHPGWEGLRSKFSLPFIYNINSSLDCSCRLHYQPPFDTEEEVKPDEEQMADIDEWCNLLLMECAKHAVEVYSCWEHDEALPMLEQITFDVTQLSNEGVFLPTQERRFISLAYEAVETENVHFMNVDLDIRASSDPQLLMDHFKNWVPLVLPADTGSPFVRFELDEPYPDAESTILAFCGDLEIMPEHIAHFWEQCPERCLDIGYYSGNEGQVLTNRFAPATLEKIARFFTQLVITIYPLPLGEEDALN